MDLDKKNLQKIILSNSSHPHPAVDDTTPHIPTQLLVTHNLL